MRRKRIAVLGSTGSIGTQTLDVIARHPERFEVVGLAAGSNRTLLREQVERFRPVVTSCASDGPDRLRAVAVESGADLVVAATVGLVALEAVLDAIERGIDVAIANKELLVAAGPLLSAAARRSGARLLPVDSEHSAVFQCVQGERADDLEGIILTASGGPFLRTSREALAAVTREQALAHPTWRMGAKNTVDSATLMNKGLEVIEAARLFDLPAERIGVVVHPSSIVHAFVVFRDGSVKAQLCAPDMQIPIGYALAWPERLLEPDGGRGFGDPLRALGAAADASRLELAFERPDLDRFPCLALAYEALRVGGTAPAVLSAADELAVEAFLDGRLRFTEIALVIEETLRRVPIDDLRALEVVRNADTAARATARELIAAREAVTAGR